MAISGPKHHPQSYIEGKNVLANMRLCANVPAQHAIATALGGYQSIHELIVPGGRLHEQRHWAWELINKILGVSATLPALVARCTRGTTVTTSAIEVRNPSSCIRCSVG